jgi:hypothetical protein
MIGRAPGLAADPPAAPDRLAIATPIGEADDALAPVSWPRTIWRLAVQPEVHPWSLGWRLKRHAPLATVAAAVLLLLLLAASGCASAPRQSLRNWAVAPRPSGGARCESVLVSQEIQVPPEGELADVRLTINEIPPMLGKLRVLVRRPRFPAELALEAERKPEFDKVLELAPAAGQRALTIVLARPRGAPGDWPRSSCRACTVVVELTGLFGAREGLDSFFARAMQEGAEIDGAFSRQAREPATHPTAALRELADGLASEAKRCAVPLEPGLVAVQAALEQLDGARAKFYAGEKPELPDAGAALQAWEAAASALESQPLAVAAAKAAGFPASLRPRSAGRLRLGAIHLELAAQVAALPPEDGPIAAQWIALAMAQDEAALEKRVAALPRIRDLAEAEARLDWVDPRIEVRLPGTSRPASLRVRQWTAARHGRRCIGALGAVPVRDPRDDAQAVAALLGADSRQRLHVAKAEDIPAVREKLQRARALLCEPLAADVASLFAGLEEKELGQVAARLDAVFREADPRREADEIARAVSARTSELLCKLLDEETVKQRVTSVAGYKVFVEGGTRVLEFVPGPLFCGGRGVTAREIRRRLRDAYREALDRHAVADRLCPVRAGKCPEEIAASVRRLFSLQRPDVAAPAPPEGRTLDYPPPFGFSDAWVQKLDRCAREACETLSRLRAEAPAGQFQGAVCAPPAPGADLPQEVTIERPDSPTSVTLASCDAHVGVRLTLRRAPDAGTLVSIASPQPFRYGSESVTRQGRHPQLGRIYERVADLTDPGDVSRRADGIFDVALTPTVANQVFYFFSLRRRDY